MLELLCATSNQHKLREFQQAAGDGVIIRGCSFVACPETGTSFEENALSKARCYATVHPECWLFADDSGLEVDALGGAPGIYSARYAGEGATDTANNSLLLQHLHGVPPEQRTARFVCSIALLHNGSTAAVFRGEAAGRILRRPSGSQGFGYDPLFHYPPLRKSFGHLPTKIKWSHSHRGKAFRALLAWLRTRS